MPVCSLRPNVFPAYPGLTKIGREFVKCTVTIEQVEDAFRRIDLEEAKTLSYHFYRERPLFVKSLLRIIEIIFTLNDQGLGEEDERLGYTIENAHALASLIFEIAIDTDDIPYRNAIMDTAKKAFVAIAEAYACRGEFDKAVDAIARLDKWDAITELRNFHRRWKKYVKTNCPEENRAILMQELTSIEDQIRCIDSRCAYASFANK